MVARCVFDAVYLIQWQRVEAMSCKYVVICKECPMNQSPRRNSLKKSHDNLPHFSASGSSALGAAEVPEVNWLPCVSTAMPSNISEYQEKCPTCRKMSEVIG